MILIGNPGRSERSKYGLPVWFKAKTRRDIITNKLDIFYRKMPNLGRPAVSSHVQMQTRFCWSAAFPLTWMLERLSHFCPAAKLQSEPSGDSEIFYPVTSSEPSAASLFFFSLFFSFLDKVLLKFWITPPFSFSWSFSCVFCVQHGRIKEVVNEWRKREKARECCGCYLQTVLILLEHEAAFSVVWGPV